jgi:hypothetical protein
MGDGGLTLAERPDEFAHADLTVRRGSEDAQDPQPDRVGQGHESIRKFSGLLSVERGTEHRRAALARRLDRCDQFRHDASY